MRRAAALARIGYGNTYPNPAVGCVIVRPDANGDDDDVVVGFGFHPRAGWPHAEVFALLEACGHVDDGVAAARSVMRSSPPSDDDHHDGASTAGGGIAASRLLLDAYASTTNGPAALFGGRAVAERGTGGGIVMRWEGRAYYLWGRIPKTSSTWTQK